MLVRDALPLRLASAGHDLWRAGDAPTLAALCDGRGDAESNAVRLRGVLASHDVELLPWRVGPPQTNEVGRLVQLMTGLLAIAARRGPRIELLGIGSSAGLNLMLDRFHIDLPGVVTGPPDSPLTLTPEWRGPPPAVPINLLTTRSVDLVPVATTTALGAQRLLASVWPDHQARFLRLATALRVLCAAPPRVDSADAVAGLAVRLAEPQAVGVPRVLMSSIVWHCLDEAPQQQMAAAWQQPARSRA